MPDEVAADAAQTVDTPAKAKPKAKAKPEPTDVPPGYAEQLAILHTLDDELNKQINEAKAETDTESADVKRLGAVRFLKEATQTLQKISDQLDAMRKVHQDTMAEQKKLQTAKEHVDAVSAKLNIERDADERRKVDLQALAETLSRQIGAKV